MTRVFRLPILSITLVASLLAQATAADSGATLATVTLEAWRLGDGPRQKLLYTLKTSGEDAHTKDNALKHPNVIAVLPMHPKAACCAKRC